MGKEARCWLDAELVGVGVAVVGNEAKDEGDQARPNYEPVTTGVCQSASLCNTAILLEVAPPPWRIRKNGRNRVSSAEQLRRVPKLERKAIPAGYGFARQRV